MEIYKLGIVSAVALILSGCGSASVTFTTANGPATSPDEANKIAVAASQGAVDFNLPVSMVVVHVAPPDASADPSAAKLADKQKKSKAGAPPVQTDGQSDTGKKDSQNGSQPTGDSGKAPAVSGTTTTVKTASNGNMSATVLPSASSLALTAIATNDAFSANQFGISKFANTDIPTTVSNQFTDLAKSSIVPLITAVGTAAVAFAADAELQSGDACASETSVPQDFSVVLSDSASLSGSAKLDKCFSYTLSVSDTQPPLSNAITRQQFTANFENKTVKFWPVPACKSETLTIKKGDDTFAKAEFTVVDPDYLKLLPFPSKGKIAFHPVCDADLSDSPVDKYQTWEDTMTALIQAAQNVKKGNTSQSGGTTKSSSATPAAASAGLSSDDTKPSQVPQPTSSPSGAAPVAAPASASLDGHEQEITTPGNDVGGNPPQSKPTVQN